MQTGLKGPLARPRAGEAHTGQLGRRVPNNKHRGSQGRGLGCPAVPGVPGCGSFRKPFPLRNLVAWPGDHCQRTCGRTRAGEPGVLSSRSGEGSCWGRAQVQTQGPEGPERGGCGGGGRQRPWDRTAVPKGEGACSRAPLSGTPSAPPSGSPRLALRTAAGCGTHGTHGTHRTHGTHGTHGTHTRAQRRRRARQPQLRVAARAGPEPGTSAPAGPGHLGLAPLGQGARQAGRQLAGSL